MTVFLSLRLLGVLGDLALKSIFATVGTEEHGGDFCAVSSVSSVVKFLFFQPLPSPTLAISDPIVEKEVAISFALLCVPLRPLR
jgi:hypothetical protein